MLHIGEICMSLSSNLRQSLNCHLLSLSHSLKKRPTSDQSQLLRSASPWRVLLSAPQAAGEGLGYMNWINNIKNKKIRLQTDQSKERRHQPLSPPPKSQNSTFHSWIQFCALAEQKCCLVRTAFLLADTVLCACIMLFLHVRILRLIKRQTCSLVDREREHAKCVIPEQKSVRLMQGSRPVIPRSALVQTLAEHY